MWYYWLMAAIGLMMVPGGATKATWAPCKWLHARASLLWKDRAHTFLLASGAAITAIGVLLATGAVP